MPTTLAGIVSRSVRRRRARALAVGAHGCDTGEQCLRFQALLAARTGGAVQVVNDAELMVPAAGYIDGIGVVSGTGSIAVARTADGKMLAAGGWGWILGDEGSAPALVREAAKAIRHSLDRGQDGDPLIAALMRELNTDDQTKLGILLNETRGAAVWGRYANAVFDAAIAGSALAIRVIREGGAGLAASGRIVDRTRRQSRPCRGRRRCHFRAADADDGICRGHGKSVAVEPGGAAARAAGAWRGRLGQAAAGWPGPFLIDRSCLNDEAYRLSPGGDAADGKSR